MTTDNEVARGEDQVSREGDDMSPKGNKGPTAASAADTQGAFGDAVGDDGQYSNVEHTLLQGPDGPEHHRKH